jgi:hypothetical protein
MQRLYRGTLALALLPLGLTACTGSSPAMPDSALTMRTLQATAAAPASAVSTPEGGTVTSFVGGTETCMVPTVVNEPVAVSTPVITHVPVSTSIPITRLVPVTEYVTATDAVPTLGCAQSVVNVPRTAMAAVESPVTYSQYTSPLMAQSNCQSSACGVGGYGGFGSGIGGFGGGFGGFGGGFGRGFGGGRFW